MTQAGSAKEQRRDSPLSGLVTSTRALLVAQLLFALLAISSGLWAASVVPAALERREALQQEIQTKQGQIAGFERTRAQLALGLPLMVSGTRALAENNVSDAVNFLSQANEAMPGDPIVLANLARALAQQGDLARAVDNANAAIAADPNQPSAYIDRAAYLCGLQRVDQASASLASAPDAVRATLATEGANSDFGRRCGRAATDIQRRLGPAQTSSAATVPADFHFTRLFFQISSEGQRPAAEALKRDIEAHGYHVVGIQLMTTPYRSSVRYYYDVQQSQADELATTLRSAAEAEHLQLGLEKLMLIPLQDRYQNLPRDRAEVWF
jgi:tetratricopeptide (TPR) repeat protein